MTSRRACRCCAKSSIAPAMRASCRAFFPRLANLRRAFGEADQVDRGLDVIEDVTGPLQRPAGALVSAGADPHQGRVDAEERAACRGDAESQFREAMDIAHPAGRALLGAALRDQPRAVRGSGAGQSAEALAVLDNVCGAFAEGADIADMRIARDLIAQLQKLMGADRATTRSSLPAAAARARQLPVGPDEVAGVAVGIALEIILMLGLGFPEVAGGVTSVTTLPGHRCGCLDVGDRIFGDPLLLVPRGEDRRTIARPRSLPWRLSVVGSWIWKKNSSIVR